ncbi:MAG TPA: SipW-dependent-type signal peptide-containing protein [Gaiellaceae bacterium]|nr:SipW-dependent-type signal peptide-containing protein [Gaiellaceae bacterium]
MSRKRLKQYLLLLMAIGVIAVAMTGGSTFASFSAQVTNPGNTFVSGTLFLHDTSGATTCTSESASLNVNPGDGSNGDNCAVLFNGADLSGGPVTAHLALQDAGTIDASALMFSVDNCTVGNNSTSTGSSVTFGTAPTCGDLYMTIQQTNSSYSTDVFCAYGPTTNNTDCNAPDNTATLATAGGPTLHALQMNDGSGNPTPANLVHGAANTKYYVITIAPSVASDNTLQNRAVSFDMTWHIDQ